MRVLGLSAFYHDSAAALVVDGTIAAAAQEERFTRKKNDAEFPREAVAYCLGAGGVELDEVDQVVFYDKPLLKFERLIETYLAFAPQGLALVPHRDADLAEREALSGATCCATSCRRFAPGFKLAGKLLFTEHHQSHAASRVLSLAVRRGRDPDHRRRRRVGHDYRRHRRGNQIEIVREIHFPHSLGLLYSAFTYYTGFKVNAGEYKVMGLAPYGEPKYAQLILDHLIDLKPDGIFPRRSELLRLLHRTDDDQRRVRRAFRRQPRRSEDPISQREMDLAASIQAVTEEVVLRLDPRARRRNRHARTCAWPEASRSTASPMARSCARAVQAHLDPARGRRCRRRAGRGARRLSHPRRPAAQHRQSARRHVRLPISARPTTHDEHRAAASTAIGAHYQRA